MEEHTPKPIHLTPEQQATLEQHLSPSSQSPVFLKNNNNNGSNNNNNNNNLTSKQQQIAELSTSPLDIRNNILNNMLKNKMDMESHFNIDDHPQQYPRSPSGGGSVAGDSDENDDTGVEKKKKKKKKKKKNKNNDGDGDDDDGGKEGNEDDGGHHNEKMRNSGDQIINMGPYSTEMSSYPLEDQEMFYSKKLKKKKKKKNQDQFLTPEERRIKEESKDAKSFFSNERTFLSWIGLTFSLGAIGTSIITWFGTEGVSLATGLFLWATSMLFMGYSTLQFTRRGHAIRTKTQGPFDDQKGPLALVGMVVVGVSIYLVFFVVIRPAAVINVGGNNSTQS
ncbi:hypothetical protein CYY_008774 [Polysphondylium violaceum]|uniref:DUF202 domain-containing protein n=1 Tax=Polysphondylium violaceum TaxID=133409 RepID=A0A8J4PMK1_9MYCE|nr:hypothetical protein CYY_008774 [Polysphondylium violaceum]